jgi:PST family polysaccharide transporter
MAADNQALGRSVRIGLALTGSADSLRHLLEFSTGIVLARLLMPSDFGIIAVVSSFMQISYVVGNFGMAGAIVQAETLEDGDCHTATAVSTAVAGLLTLAGIVFAPQAAAFFSMPVLADVMPIMAVQITLAGISSIPLALLRRDFRFGRVAIVESGGAAIYASIGISLALSGYGVWSLVWAPLGSAVWILASSTALAGYVPLPVLNRESVAKLWRFGSGLTLKNVFVYIGRNVDNFIVARALGDAATGVYNRAFNLTRMPQTRLVGILYRVCFPAFCRLRDDRPRFHDWYLRATTAVAVGITPLLLGLGSVAGDFTVAVLGEQWSDMIIPLQILCVSALISCLHTLGGAAIEATGRVHYEVYTQSTYSVLVVVGCLIGTQWGINGVAVGVLGASISLYAMKAFTIRAATGLPISSYISAVVPSVLAGIVMSAVVIAYRATDFAPDDIWLRLFSSIAIGAVTYPIALALIAREHLRLVFTQGRLIFSRNSDTSAGERIEAPS